MKLKLPNYEELGYSDKMGNRLRIEVERQLIDDLFFYKIDSVDLKFDWSESCIEGHRASFLEGVVENYSGITVFDNEDNVVAGGWMEFIKSGDFFLVYWEFVKTWQHDIKLKEKKEVGIPSHIWKQLPDKLKAFHRDKRLKK